MANENGIKRIVVVGTCGSGKTTLADALAERMGVPHIELDALHWGPNWTPVDPDVFQSRTEAALAGDAWTVDGNYSKVRDVVWSRAEMVIWLRYRLSVIYKQLIWREIRHVWQKEIMWGINRVRLRDILGRESLLWDALPSDRRHRRRIPVLFGEPEHAHLQTVILGSPHEMHTWMRHIRIENGQLFV